MKLWEKVNNLTGNASKARFLIEHLNAGAKFIVSSLPERFLWSIASETEIDGFNTTGTNIVGNGSSIAYDKILAVYRFDGSKKRVAQELPDMAIHATDESDSLSFPTKMFPKYYKLSGKIYIKPDPDYNNYTGLTDNTCDTTINDATVSMDSTSLLQVGMKVTGVGIPADTTIVSIAGNGTQFELSGNATANGTNVTLTFNRIYTPVGGSLTALDYQEGDKGVIVYSAPPLIDENTDAWVLTEFENVALLYAASLDYLRLSSSIDAEKILEGAMASSDATSKTSLSAIHWLEDEDPEMAASVLQVSQGNLSLANQRLQSSMSYYQRAVSELQAISGAIAAPEQQQQAQRKQQGATT
jgi:hypothetical protein|tara:strand:- start:1300 stop:2367 length:1068 start_codon:yes stop_codon:yes gene_type:complete